MQYDPETVAPYLQDHIVKIIYCNTVLMSYKGHIAIKTDEAETVSMGCQQVAHTLRPKGK